MLIRPLTLFGATLFTILSLGGCPAVITDNTYGILTSTSASNVRTVPTTANLATSVVSEPIFMVNGLPFVEVTVNDAGPFLFLLDTGAATTVVSPEVASRFPENVTLSNVRVSDSTADTIPANSVLHLDTLDLGALELTGFDAVTLDLSDLSATFGVEIGGILGFPAFNDLLLTIDYGNNTVLISDETLDSNSADVIAMNLVDGHPYVDVKIGDSDVATMLDSGHAGSYSLPSDTPGISFEVGPLPWFSSVDLSGPSSRKIARLAGDVELGLVTWETPVVTVDGPATPNIGSGLLSFFTVSFDQRSGLVQISTGGEPTTLQSASVATYGLQISNDGTQTIVTEVLAGSPAHLAGIQVGDVLTTVDGLDAGQVAPSVLNRAVESITLEIVRDGEVLVTDVDRTIWVR